MKNNASAYMTLDQFTRLASRFQAKIDFIKYKLSQYKDCEEHLKPVVVDDVLQLLDKPCDAFISDLDMQRPLAGKCEQVDFFDKELC